MDARKQAVLLEIAKLLVEHKRDVLQKFMPKGCCGTNSQPDYVWANQGAYKIGRLLETNQEWINSEVMV